MMQRQYLRQRKHTVLAAIHDNPSSRTAAVRAVASPRTVQPKPPALAARRVHPALQGFTQVWLARLLQQQEDLQETYGKVAKLSERLASEVTSYKAKIVSVVQDMLVPTQAAPAGKRLLPRQVAQPPQLDLSVLDAPDTHGSSQAAESPEAELAALASSIQDTNELVREVDSLYRSTNSTIVQLQEGAAERDKVQDEACDALLQYADELEMREREQAAAMAAWEAEQARVAAERAAYEAEQARIAAQEAEARRLAEAAAREAERLAELSKPVPTSIKVDVGVQLQTKPGQDVVLVGSHPTLGSWDLNNALPLAWSDGHVWRASLELPHDCDALEYKAVLVRPTGPAVWEKGSNHKAELQGSKDISLFHVFEA